MKISVRIFASEEIRSSDCVMLSRLGDIYPCIENKFHPHCGNKDLGYPKIYSAVDWMIANRVNRGCKAINDWISQQLSSCYEDGLDLELAIEVIFASIDPSARTSEICSQLWKTVDTVSYDISETVKYAELIDAYLNQNFLRVRSGGKLNSGSADSIYFRISSKDYDWRNIIEDFLWDTFKSIDSMPSLIWIGHDEETNPPEIVLFEGSPEDLFGKFDSKVFASTKFN